MANPPPFIPSFSYTGYQAINPTRPLPGPMVDNDFADAADSINQTITALSSVRRADGALVNGIVTQESLASDLTIGVQTATAWVTARAYTVGNIVVQGNKFYTCAVAHTSGVFATDLAALKWTEVTLSITGYSADQVTYDNAVSGLAAVNVKTALDEIDASVDPLVALNVKNANIASAATTDIGAATGRLVHVTGVVTITGFGTAAAGAEREVVFDAILTLTHNATSLILPGAANITTAAGDAAIMVSEGGGNWRCLSYSKALPGIDDNATGERLQIADTIATWGTAGASFTHVQAADDQSATFSGGNGPASGANWLLAGGTHATLAKDAYLRSGSNIVYQWDDSANTHIFTTNAAGSIAGLTGTTNYITGLTKFGTTATSASPGNGNNLSGVVIDDAGTVYASRGGTVAVFNRTTDGNTISINGGGVNAGIISISAGVVTYGTFFGSHWSQLLGGKKLEIWRGTIVESLNEMCEWPDEEPEERLPRFKVSDTPGSRSVYGVFAWWEVWDVNEDGDPIEPPTNDAFIGSLGAFVIRIAAGETVQRGDYIESNGKGCGRVQNDDILRSSTVAKVTSTTIVETYSDGSYLVPCTLHCG